MDSKKAAYTQLASASESVRRRSTTGRNESDIVDSMKSIFEPDFASAKEKEMPTVKPIASSISASKQSEAPNSKQPELANFKQPEAPNFKQPEAPNSKQPEVPKPITDTLLGVRLDIDPKYGCTKNEAISKYSSSGCTIIAAVASFVRNISPSADFKTTNLKSMPIACHQCVSSSFDCKHWTVSDYKYGMTITEGFILKTVTELKIVAISCNSCDPMQKGNRDLIVLGESGWCRCLDCNRRVMVGKSTISDSDYSNPVRPPRAICKTCNSTGKRPKWHYKKCETCDGIGGERCGKCIGHPGLRWEHANGWELKAYCGPCKGSGLCAMCEDCSGFGSIRFAVQVDCTKCEP